MTISYDGLLFDPCQKQHRLEEASCHVFSRWLFVVHRTQHQSVGFHILNLTGSCQAAMRDHKHLLLGDCDIQKNT